MITTTTRVWRDARAKANEQWAVTIKRGALVWTRRFKTRKMADEHARQLRVAK